MVLSTLSLSDGLFASIIKVLYQLYRGTFNPRFVVLFSSNFKSESALSKQLSISRCICYKFTKSHVRLTFDGLFALTGNGTIEILLSLKHRANMHNSNRLLSKRNNITYTVLWEHF